MLCEKYIMKSSPFKFYKKTRQGYTISFAITDFCTGRKYPINYTYTTTPLEYL